MNKRVWQSVCKALSLALVFALTITLISPIRAEAKTLKLKDGDTTDFFLDYVDSVSTNITKTGTYKVVQKKNRNGVYIGYIRFVAPKTKKYTITLSNLKCKGNEKVYGGVQPYIINDEGDQIQSIMISTKGGPNSTLQLSHKKMGSNLIPKRTGKITLNEGQVLYLRYQFIVRTKGKKLTSKLVIK